MSLMEGMFTQICVAAKIRAADRHSRCQPICPLTLPSRSYLLSVDNSFTREAALCFDFFIYS